MSKQSTSEPSKENEESKASVPVKKMCGIIMPIADTLGYDNGHWNDVLNILKDALTETEFEAKLVSERADIGSIHEKIINNIYDNEIVICDVSSNNPNVMFELGMRLAFDKPTILIKDEKTTYSFDIAGILHLNYPSSLRHNLIEKFKSDLSGYVAATHKKSIDEPDSSPYLKNFKNHIIAKKIEKSEISEGQFIIEKLDQLSKRLITSERKSSLVFHGVGSDGREDSLPVLVKDVLKPFLIKNYGIIVLEDIANDKIKSMGVIEFIKTSNQIYITQKQFTELVIEILTEELL